MKVTVQRYVRNKDNDLEILEEVTVKDLNIEPGRIQDGTDPDKVYVYLDEKDGVLYSLELDQEVVTWIKNLNN